MGNRYRGPQYVVNTLLKYVSTDSCPRILDVGAGTGLVAQLVKRLSKSYPGLYGEIFYVNPMILLTVYRHTHIPLPETNARRPWLVIVIERGSRYGDAHRKGARCDL